MRLPAAILVLCLSLAGAPAYALSVESAPLPDRVAAQALADGLGVERPVVPGVIRRFQRGQGWGYLVVVDGVSDRAIAVDLARRLTTDGGPGLIYDDVDGERVAVPHDGPIPALRPAVGSTEPAPAIRNPRPAQVEAVLRAAVRAHGGSEAGLPVLAAASTVRFVFNRRLAGPEGDLVASHRFLRSGDAVRVEVAILEGRGVDSVTVLTPANQAWLTTADSSIARDPGRAREVLSRFSPDEVLALPLGLANDVDTAAAWRGLQIVPGEQGGDVVRLVPGSGDRPARGLVEAAFDDATHRLVRLVWSDEQGDVTFRYGDYVEVTEGLLVPRLVSVERGGTVVEEIRVEELAIDIPLDPGLFKGPSDSGR